KYRLINFVLVKCKCYSLTYSPITKRTSGSIEVQAQSVVLIDQINGSAVRRILLCLRRFVVRDRSYPVYFSRLQGCKACCVVSNRDKLHLIYFCSFAPVVAKASRPPC